VDPFALIIFSGLAVTVLCVWLVGRFYPGSGMNELGMRSARQIHEQREALEAEDLDQMIAARNARRRARGESEITVADLELQVAQDVRDSQQRREAYLADRELDQLLEATNARRRARGAAPRTREEARREFGLDPADQSPPAPGPDSAEG
jgi:hypothetical protein